jgi:outer membrane protein assembly factor BamB
MLYDRPPTDSQIGETPLQGAVDVFVSYNHRDKSFVNFLVQLFRRVGLSCFQDISGLKIYEKLDASLKASIARSRWLMAIISPSYLQSYWCLFEALEAIQGQDLEQRFLPIFVRYRPEDQSLDEDFVLKALQDLDDQMREFETKIVRMRAFDLSGKLQKLQFVRQTLPKVFIQMHERLYPELLLWDDEAVRVTLNQIIMRVAPESNLDIATVPLEFVRLAATPVVIPRLRELPVLIWKAKTGCQAWKNSPLVVGNDVLVGSAGSCWNEADEEDGIYCVDAETGTTRWFASTPIDSNRLLVSKGRVVTGCDDGSIECVSMRDGSLLWQNKLDSGVVGGPIKVSGDGKSDPALFATYNGNLYLIDLGTGREIQCLELQHELLATPLFCAPWAKSYQLVVAPTRTAELLFVWYREVTLTLGRTVKLHDIAYTLAAEPAFANGLLLQGLVRETYFDDPPLVAIDVNGQTRWLASDPERKADGFGNLRSPPVIIGQEVVFAAAYSNKLCAVSIDNGALVWTVDLSQGMFEQWSGPVARGSSIYIGRSDGYVHKVNSRGRHREWSVFLGDNTHAGMAVAATQQLPEFRENDAWAVFGSAPIRATPALDRGRLYVGTWEGYLYCLGNLGEDHNDS